MLLRKLEAYGFKSFAEKTEIEFKSGITAIVGPNGSGKSNISDAVRWVLGEQNIRNLRGAKMEDVIFSGSAKRRPLGVAEVSLVFDNSDGLLPIDFNEVTITRRVFRSGDSEYFINKSSCRLKDIHDLLIDAGLGRESMTVISQNKVDEVLNSKADERRILFEEAAGIIKYKNRKKEAVRKLDDTEQNLTRVYDITSEIESQLGPLEESAERTTRYNELAAEQTACQVTLLLDKLVHAEKNQESVSLEQTALADEEIKVGTRLAVAETDKERFTDQLFELDETIRGVEAAMTATATEIERIEGKAAVLTERIGQEQRNKDRFGQEIIRIQQEKDENRIRLTEWQEGLSAKRQQAADLDVVLSTQQQQFTRLQASISQVEQQIDMAKDETFGHLQELVTQKNALRTMERDLETQKSRELQVTKEREGFRTQLEETERLAGNIKAEQTSLEQEVRATDKGLGELGAKKSGLEKELSGVADAESRLTNHLGEMTSRVKILVNMQDDYEGFGRGVKSVLKSSAAWRKDVCGAVAQVVNVPEQYVVAVETALGGALQHIIVNSDVTAKAAIEFLKSQNGGRATFLPLNTIKINRPKESEQAAAHSPGALGFAADLIECEAQYRPVVEYLLARTVVAKDIDAALKIARQQSFSVKIVTLDGELISPGGSITGGSAGRREASYLGRESEIQTLKEAMQSKETERAALRRQAEGLQADIASVLSEITEANNLRRSLEVRQAELTVHSEKTALDINRLTMALGTLDAEIKTCLNEFSAITAKMNDVGKYITTLEDRDSEHKRQLGDWQNQLRELTDQRESMSNALTDTKIKNSALQQEINAITANCEQYEQADSRLARQIEALRGDQGRVDAEIAQATAELSEIHAQRDSLEARKEEQKLQRDSHMTEKLSVLAKQQKLERELKDLRRKQNSIQSRVHELELLAAKFGYEVGYCNEQLRDHYCLSREQAQELYRQEDQQVLEAKISALEEEIIALGPVNPAAIDEYTRLKERYEFLRTQYQDLMEAKNYLMSIIKDIDNTMARQFRVAFQQINEHFGDLFVRLFGGGKAQLELLEPDNILGSGIEITVQPPGKKQQNLALLSGGERALTVIALLFAFLTYRPTPFCVLDEIDAALDEANVQRFSDFLKDYSNCTQFIIVTHRKGTMEAADVMHGVTMEESGVSKLISVKFMEKAG